jgi:primosomal protein N'
MNTFQTSKGERISKGKIDRNIRKAKEMKLTQFINEHGYYFCEDCEAAFCRLDCSHDISVNEAQNSGRTELAWDVNNITLRCRECHRKHNKS